MNCFKPKFQEAVPIPNSIVQLKLEDEIQDFMDKTNKILHETGMPIIPFAFFHCLIPFSPLCAAYTFSHLRKSRLKALLEHFNNKIDETGIFVEWNEYFHVGFEDGESPGLNIKMDVTKRQQYCTKTGIPFQSFESSPLIQFPSPYPDQAYQGDFLCVPDPQNLRRSSAPEYLNFIQNESEKRIEIYDARDISTSTHPSTPNGHVEINKYISHV